MEKQSLVQQTVRRLYELIAVEKRRSAGEKLPSELELSRQLGVSRATLREAIRTLSTQGIVEVRRGSGTYVSERIEAISGQGFSGLDQVRGQLRDLFELREVFGPGAARVASRRATREELAEILACGARVEACIRAGQDRTEADRAFHTAIVRATHNEYMMRLLPMIDQSVATAVAAGEHREQLAQDTLQDHALLLEFFQKRDECGAEYAMAIHIRRAVDAMELEQKNRRD